MHSRSFSFKWHWTCVQVVSLSPSLSFSLSLSLSHTHTHTHPYLILYGHVLTVSHTQPIIYTDSILPCRNRRRKWSLPPSLPLSLSHTHTHTPHTHTHAPTWFYMAMYSHTQPIIYTDSILPRRNRRRKWSSCSGFNKSLRFSFIWGRTTQGKDKLHTQQEEPTIHTKNKNKTLI